MTSYASFEHMENFMDHPDSLNKQLTCTVLNTTYELTKVHLHEVINNYY